ncbi:unnamed protein product [Allacma fusca]|nr:unnamed protein product [Allacma fusca]
MDYNVKYQFICYKLESCYEQMISAYISAIGNGRNVIWLPIESDATRSGELFNWARNAQEKKLQKLTDFDLQPHDATSIYILQDLNLTYFYNHSNIRISYALSPDIRLNTMYYDKGQDFLTGMTQSFRFITPYGIYDVKSSYTYFLYPFKLSVWYWILLTSFSVTLILYLISRIFNGRNSFRSLLQEIFLVVCAILDQGREAIVGNIPKSNKKLLTALRRIVGGFWLTALIFLQNSYKGALESDFSTDTPVQTSLQKFEQLKNFSLYVLHGNPSLCLGDNNNDFTADMKRANCIGAHAGTIKECRFFQLTFLHIAKTSVGFRSLKNSSLKDSLWENFLTYQEFKRNTNLLCLNHFRNFFLQNYNNTKVAFILDPDEFNFLWGFIQNQLKEWSNLSFVKLAPSQKLEGDFFVTGLGDSFAVEKMAKVKPNQEV